MKIITLLVMATFACWAEDQYWVVTAYSGNAKGQAYVIAVDKSGVVMYFAMTDKDGKVVSSPGTLRDNEFGPDLSKSSIEIQVSPLSMNLRSTSYGQSLRILREEKVIKLQDVKVGIKYDKNGNYIASFWCDRIDVLPKTVDEFLKFKLITLEKVSKIKGEMINELPVELLKDETGLPP